MRTTIELAPELHESVRRLAQRLNLSTAKLLGHLVERGLSAQGDETLPSARSGRFQVIARAEGQAKVSSARVQKVIDEEGIL